MDLRGPQRRKRTLAGRTPGRARHTVPIIDGTLTPRTQPAGTSPTSLLKDSDMEDIDWDTITETSNNHPSDITLPLYRHLSVLPDTGNLHDLFSTKTPRTLYDTRFTARHQCKKANRGQTIGGKGTQVHTTQDTKISKTLPTGKEAPHDRLTENKPK